MKIKKISNRKKIVLITIALLLSIVGTTYAWWTSYSEIKQKITMGNLNITADFESIDADIYEPGTNLEIEGKIKNTGTIPTLLKIDNNSKIQFIYSDESFTLIPESERKYVYDIDKAINISFKPKSGLYNDPLNTSVYWFKDEKSNSYLLMDPKAEVDVIIQGTFDGNIMKNRYQDALIEFSSKIHATQVIDGAIKNEFGISSSDLVGIEDENLKSKSLSNDRAINYLNQLLNR